MRTLKRGILIALEGIDGSGKTTLAQNLATSLSQDFPIILTKEPGATPLGKKLRTLLQEQSIPLSPKAEYLLFAADRAHHFSTLVLPALEQKSLVISDRMADSSLVYQGYGRGLSLDTIASINAWAMENHSPDLVIYVKIDPATAHARLVRRGKLSAFEQEQAFIQKLDTGFDTIFKDRNNVILLDGTLDPARLTEHATERCMSWLQQQKLIL